ncbi:MAG: threonyl-tRNA synthetase editing domain-containing protein [Candidatus Omnitrophica bacterium]|nr:threonyl-tRNA synthetase editing domain-containing protein [Candidatus Omnitrophota bacterium]
MKALFFICDQYQAFNIKRSYHVKSCLKSSFKGRLEKMEGCIGVFITVEKEDKTSDKKRLLKDIYKFSKEHKLKKVLVAPFSHLSSQLASSKKAIYFISGIESDLINEGFNVERSSFGYHKNLLLSVSGTNNNIMWRSYSHGDSF